MTRRPRDHRALLAEHERRTLLAQSAKDKARRDAQATAQGVSETIALGEYRGEAFHAPAPDRGGRAKPVRRLTGLQWVARSGGFSEGELAAGDAYGAAYRAAMSDPHLRSCLEAGVGGGAKAIDPARIASRAEWRVAMSRRLARYRAVLHHPRLIEVCDLICGEELTPRQAGRNGQEAGTMTELLNVALGMIEREGRNDQNERQTRRP